MKFPAALAGRITIRFLEAGLLVALPLAFYRGVAEQFSTPKFFLSQCLVIMGLAVWAMIRIWAPPIRRSRFSLGLPLLAFSVMAAISCLDSPVPRFSFREVEFALCGPAWVLLLVSWERGESAIRRIVALIAVAGGLVAAITLLQWLGLDPVLLGGYEVDWGSLVGRMRLYSTLGNPNYVGGYLIGTVFAAAALAAATKARWAKALWFGFTVVMLAAIVESGSRGAWLGLMVGLAAAVMYLVLLCDSRREVIRAAFANVKIFVPPSVYWLLAILTPSLTDRVANQLYGRIYLWRFSLPMFWQHPLMGSGWGTYQLIYLDLQAKFLSAHPECVGYWTNNRLLHNDPLQLLMEMGLLGFAAFLWVLWKYGHEALRVGRESTDAGRRYVTAASVGGVTAILVDSVFNYQFAVPPTYILLFTLLAIPALLRNAEVEKEGEYLPALFVHPSPFRNGVKGAASLLIVIAASALLWQQARTLASERYYEIASDFDHLNNLASAEDAFRHSLALNDLNGRAHFGLSRVLYSTGRPSDALTEIARAERTYANPNEEVLRARILVGLGRKREALAAYHYALWLDPALFGLPEEIDHLRQMH